MPRRRLGVALLVPPPWAHEIDGLRRACGDRQLDRVPSHCTLVPPVNVREADVADALALVRAAAAARSPSDLKLRLGPPATFHPDSPTLHLPVHDADGAIETLRAAMFRGPLERSTTWPFVPHVTLADDIDVERSLAATTALADYRRTVPVDRVHVLEQQPVEGGGRRWVPIADASFRPPAIVGRGGIEIELSATELVDPLAAEVLGPVPNVPRGARPLVISARRRGVVVGVLVGWTRGAENGVVERRVVDDHKGMGIGRHLVAAFDGHAADGEIDGA